MKNYYEILEVSKNASKEVIEKAYKVLAKKYHPDLQQDAQKEEAEQKMKLINEAYELLSDDEKRKNYDFELEVQEQEKIRKIQNETARNIQENIKNQQNQIKNEQVNQQSQVNQKSVNNNYYTEDEVNLTKEQWKKQVKEERKMQREYQEEQDKIYRNYMRSLGYRVKERWTWKRFIKLLQTLGIIVIIIFIIWIFPPTHKLIVQTYEENRIIKAIVDSFVNIIKGIGIGIGTFFKSIFSKS